MIPKCLLFGGSFDPPYKVHLQLVSFILNLNAEKKIADRMIIIPAHQSPLKLQQSHSTVLPFHRHQMLKLAIESLSNSLQKKITVCDIELQRPPPSYTVDTLDHLAKKYFKEKLALLIGDDHLPHLDLWHKIKDIIECYPLYVFCRYRSVQENQKMISQIKQKIPLSSNSRINISVLDNPRYECSSSKIREEMRQNKSVDGAICKKYLDERVRDYIQENKLYF